jgi:hypothetical protein
MFGKLKPTDLTTYYDFWISTAVLLFLDNDEVAIPSTRPLHGNDYTTCRNELYLGSSEANLEYDTKYKSIAQRREWTGVRCLEEAGMLNVILDKFQRPSISNNALGNSFVC